MWPFKSKNIETNQPYIQPKLASYPKWKHLVPQDVSYEKFNESWKMIFEYPIEQCKAVSSQEIKGDEILSFLGKNSVIIKTPSGTHCNGGFGFYTDEPNLGGDTDFYYDCGCTWAEDLDGNKFCLIDKQTNLPYEFEKVIAKEIIMKYINNNYHGKIPKIEK